MYMHFSATEVMLRSQSCVQGVFTALQGIKAENTLVIALFLKFILLSTSSVTAAHLARAGNMKSEAFLDAQHA